MDEIYADSHTLAGWLGIGVRRVAQLGHETSAKRSGEGWPAGPLVRAHCARLRERADLADARRKVLEVQADRARVAAARAAGTLIPSTVATAAAQELWGSTMAEFNAVFSEIYHDILRQGADPADARRVLEGIRKALLRRLTGLRDRLPSTFSELALDSAEKREGWLAAETPEPPSTRRAKATRRAPSR